MADRIKLEILTPHRAIFSDMVDEVILPGTDGELGIFPGHLPLMTTLRSGSLIATQGATRHKFAVHDGFAEVLPNHIVVLTEAAEDVANIDTARARRALEEAERELAKSDRAQIEADAHLDLASQHQIALERARARLFVAEEDKR